MAAVLLLALLTAPVARGADDLYTPWDQILKAAVKGDRIDYQRIAERHAPELKGFLDAMAKVDVGPLTREQKLAYYINLYNATMVQAVLDRGPASFKPSDDGFSVFKAPLVRTLNGPITLDRLENQIIRPTFKDPRVHVALVCGAVSCPPLIDHAYRAQTLDQQLDENVRRWLRDPKRNRIDRTRKALQVSRIFDWYADDFGGRARINDWIGRQLGEDLEGCKLTFVPYDWSLNRAE